MICYHHTDMDGKAAGHVVHICSHLGSNALPSSFIPTNYEDKFDKHTEKDDVYIVDISISEATYQSFLSLCKTAKSVTWIDHHQTSIDVIENHKDELQHISNLTYFVSTCASGAALTYAYMNIPDKDELLEIRKINENEYYSIAAIMTNNIITITAAKVNKDDPTDSTWKTFDISLPLYLTLIDDYDCWKKTNASSELFILGCGLYDTRLVIKNDLSEKCTFNSFWDAIVNEKVVNSLIKYGSTIRKYLKAKYTEESSMMFTWEFEGIKFLCKNSTGNSWNFDDVDKAKGYKAYILFEYDGKNRLWLYSVYSDDKSDFDCSKFCEMFGGGGHFHASGFSSKELIFFKDANILMKRKKVLFLNGTSEESGGWREEFINACKKFDSPIIKELSIFDSTTIDWNKEFKNSREMRMRTSKINLFLITPNGDNTYHLCEAIDNSHYTDNVFLAVYDKFGKFTAEELKVFSNIGELIRNNGCRYSTYIDKRADMNNLIADLISNC